MPGFTLKPEDGNFPEGIWTPYGRDLTPEEEAAGTRREAYKIRALSQAKWDHFTTMATKKRWRNGQQVEEIDQDRRAQLLWDYLIEDWEAVYIDDAQTIPAPCTLENKVLLAANSLDRQNFIFSQGRLYADDDDARRAAQEAAFRQTHPAQAGFSEPGLPGVPAAV